MERDEVYVPQTRMELNIPSKPDSEIDWDEIFGDTPIYTLFLLIRQQVLAFPAYLLMNVSGSHICTTRILYSLTTGIPSGRSKEALQQQLTGTLFIAIPTRPPTKPLITPSRDFLGWQGRFFLHDGELYGD
ncbi:hypothetical protein RhiTH_004831 [Rhizoctonia solani]